MMILALVVAALCAAQSEARDVLLRLRKSTDPLLDSLANGRVTRGAVKSLLTEHVHSSQEQVLRLLDQEQVTYREFWIDNVVAVEAASEALVQRLLLHSEVVSVEEDSHVQLPKLSRDAEAEAESYPQGNIQALKASQVWKAGFTGQGVVVATIDSGVRWSHEALRSNYRGLAGRSTVNHDYAFWTPKSQVLTPENADIFGHGSHVMGTLAGSGPYGIGMAPNATWITAKAFNWDGAAKKSDILAAAQWVMCPTKYNHSHEDCSKGADIVSCSFGGNSTTTWLNPAVKAMRAAGVLPVFSAGNVNSMKCGSILEPAGSEDAIAVGGADAQLRLLYGQSGKGPGLKGIKPDLVAPYRGIRSVCSGADSGKDAYMRLTGTSMSTPHVSGALALLLSLASAPTDALSALKKTADKEGFKKPLFAASDCGGTNYSVYPNNIYGWGFPNVCAAADHLGTRCQITSTEMLV